jgi:hypothetical protein
LSAACSDHGAAAADRDAAVAVVIDGDAIAAGLFEGHRYVRRVDLENFICRQSPDVERSGAFAEIKLLDVVAQIERGQVAARRKPDEVAGGKLDFSAAVLRENAIADGERHVLNGVVPLVGIIAPAVGHSAGNKR